MDDTSSLHTSVACSWLLAIPARASDAEKEKEGMTGGIHVSSFFLFMLLLLLLPFRLLMLLA
jgi:hypothetical protein